MASSSPVCDICLHFNSSQTAKYYCFFCNENLCLECEDKHRVQSATNDHKSITIDEYKLFPASITAVNQVFTNHDKRLELYCKDHDVACCFMCVSSAHRKCEDIQPLEDVVRNVKKSVSIGDSKNRIDDIHELIKRLEGDLKEEKSRISSESERVVDEVKNFRAQIDKHLDMIQGKILDNIKTIKEEQLYRLNERESRLKNIEDEANKMSSNFETLVQCSSDVHIYLTMNKMEFEIKECEDRMRTVQKENDFSFDSFDLQIAQDLLRLTTDVEKFGIVEIQNSKLPLYCLRKERQSQKRVRDPSIKLNELVSFVIEGDKEEPDLCGCCIDESGEMIICDFNGSRLVKTSTQGKLIMNIHLPIKPRDVKPVDESTVAVTGENKLILMNINTDEMLKIVYEGKHCRGLYYKDGVYTVCTGNRMKILRINSKGKMKSKIRTDSWVYYCCVKNDKLYYTEPLFNTVVCSDMKGKTIWKKQCAETGQIGMTVDHFDNVFVACTSENMVIRIDKSDSGKKSEILLTKEDGMDAPQAIYFCEKNRYLLVCNTRGGSCFLYNVC